MFFDTAETCFFSFIQITSNAKFISFIQNEYLAEDGKIKNIPSFLPKNFLPLNPWFRSLSSFAIYTIISLPLIFMAFLLTEIESFAEDTKKPLGILPKIAPKNKVKNITIKIMNPRLIIFNI